jgi:hypothetical protein
VCVAVVGDSTDFFSELSKVAVLQKKGEYIFMQALRAF